MSRSLKISATKNYRLFHRSDENRALGLKKHRRLAESMRLYGFLWCFPVICVRDDVGNLIVKDGQHRLAFAEELGLTVYYIIADVDFDVAIINCTPEKWTLRDYAQKFAANGLDDYQEGIDFAERNLLPIGTAFGLLAGTATFHNVEDAFKAGRFIVKDRDWADAVATIYTSYTELSSHVKNARFIEACMAVCRVKDIDKHRLIKQAERCRDKLISYSTRDAYLDMLDEIYNFGRTKQVPLRFLAIQAMRERNAAVVARNAKAVREAVVA